MANKLEGICVSPGVVTGRLRIYQEKTTYTKDDIVALDVWVTSGVALLKDAGGLISSKGGITCHAFIIAREYNLPCLVAVKNLGELKEGTKIKLDATGEEITIL